MKKRLLTVGIILAIVCALVLAIVFLLPGKPTEDNSLTILQQPALVGSLQDQQASISVTAEGENLRYQWYEWDADKQEYVLAEQTGPVYYPDASAVGEHKVHCVITDARGNSVQSETVSFTVEAPKHTHSYTVEEIPATCKAEATAVYRCDCGEAYTEVKEGSKLSHSFSEYRKNNDATCTADGTKTAKCIYCGVTKTRTIKGSKLPHSFTEYQSDHNATCTEDGTETAVCVGCKTTKTRKDKGSKLSHSFTAYHSDNNATCTEDGTETAKCDRCEETDARVVEDSKLSHSFTAYHSDNNATCTEDGTETAKCDRCEETDTRVVEGSKLSHSFTAYHSDNNATCTEDGTETAKCDNCDATDTRVAEGSKRGHTYVSGTCGVCGDTPTGVKITKQPTNVTIVGGMSGSVSVSATGDDLTYEWYYKDADSEAFVRAAATGSTYTITMTNNADGRLAYCIVRDKYGNSVQSGTVKFTKKATSSGSGATGEEGDIFIPFW